MPRLESIFAIAIAFGAAAGCSSTRGASGVAACPGADDAAAQRLLRPLEVDRIRAFGERGDLKEDARAGIAAMLEERWFDAVAHLVPGLDRAGDKKTEKAQTLELYLADSFLRAELLYPAMEAYMAMVLKGGAHPHFAASVQGLLVVDALLGERTVGKFFYERYTHDFARLPVPVLDRMNTLIGLEMLRRGKLGDAGSYLLAVSPKSDERPRATRAFDGTRELLAKSAEKGKDDQQIERARADLIRELGLMTDQEEQQRAACELQREKEIVSERIPEGAVRDQLLTAIEKHRAAAAPTAPAAPATPAVPPAQ